MPACHLLATGRHLPVPPAGMVPWQTNGSVPEPPHAALRVGRSAPHRSPATMTAPAPASCLPTARVLRNCLRRAPRALPGPRCWAIRSPRLLPGTATRHRLQPTYSPPRRARATAPRGRARRALRGRQGRCRCGSETWMTSRGTAAATRPGHARSRRGRRARPRSRPPPPTACPSKARHRCACPSAAPSRHSSRRLASSQHPWRPSTPCQ